MKLALLLCYALYLCMPANQHRSKRICSIVFILQDASVEYIKYKEVGFIKIVFWNMASVVYFLVTPTLLLEFPKKKGRCNLKDMLLSESTIFESCKSF